MSSTEDQGRKEALLNAEEDGASRTCAYDSGEGVVVVRGTCHYQGYGGADRRAQHPGRDTRSPWV
jgi:hypothetical protein